MAHIAVLSEPALRWPVNWSASSVITNFTFKLSHIEKQSSVPLLEVPFFIVTLSALLHLTYISHLKMLRPFFKIKFIISILVTVCLFFKILVLDFRIYIHKEFVQWFLRFLLFFLSSTICKTWYLSLCERLNKFFLGGGLLIRWGWTLCISQWNYFTTASALLQIIDCYFRKCKKVVFFPLLSVKLEKPSWRMIAAPGFHSAPIWAKRARTHPPCTFRKQNRGRETVHAVHTWC